MKLLKTTLFLIIAFSITCIACSSDDDTVPDTIDETTITTDYEIASVLSLFDGTGLSYQVNGNTITFITQDLPNHTSPYWGVGHAMYEAYNGTNSNFNQNPGSIGAQNITFTIPLNQIFNMV